MLRNPVHCPVSPALGVHFLDGQPLQGLVEVLELPVFVGLLDRRVLQVLVDQTLHLRGLDQALVLQSEKAATCSRLLGLMVGLGAHRGATDDVVGVLLQVLVQIVANVSLQVGRVVFLGVVNARQEPLVVRLTQVALLRRLDHHILKLYSSNRLHLRLYMILALSLGISMHFTPNQCIIETR